MNMNVNGQMDNMLAYLATQGTDLALKVAGAVAAWMIGRWLIALATRLLGRMLSRSGRLDVTLVDYLKSITSVLLTIMLALGILSLFGVQTTSFAALLAGAGLASARPGEVCSPTSRPACSCRCCAPTRWETPSRPLG